jgi:hypothetical protein
MHVNIPESTYHSVFQHPLRRLTCVCVCVCMCVCVYVFRGEYARMSLSSIPFVASRVRVCVCARACVFRGEYARMSLSSIDGAGHGPAAPHSRLRDVISPVDERLYGPDPALASRASQV